jgi:integrase
MLGYGVDVKIVSQRLGHSTPAITQKIYQHVTEKMDNDAAEKLNRILLK